MTKKDPGVTKKDIVRAISDHLKMPQQQTKKIVQLTFDTIIDSLVSERRIELRNFGVFEVKPRAARKARNPRTGQQVDVPMKYVVTFKPGKNMEAKVRELEEEAPERTPESDAVRNAVNQAAKPRSATNNSPPERQVNPPMTPPSPSGRWDVE